MIEQVRLCAALCVFLISATTASATGVGHLGRGVGILDELAGGAAESTIAQLAEPSFVGSPDRSGPDAVAVREIQTLLARLGFDPGPSDGVFGRRTASAIRAFEGERGLAVTGAPSDSILTALRGAAQGQAGRVIQHGSSRPSFDCRNAATPTELAICGSDDLADLDRAVARNFATALEVRDEAGRAQLHAEQFEWIAQRDRCGSDAMCLVLALGARSQELVVLASEHEPGATATPPTAGVTLVLPAGTAGEDTGSAGCRDLLLAADLVQPLETVEDPAGQIALLVNQSPGGIAGSYRIDLYGSGAEDILYLGRADYGVIAGDGDDRIFVFDAEAPGLVVGEGGADTVILCSLAAPYSAVALNSSIVNSDSEPDTVILGPGVFTSAAGFGRNIVPWGGVNEEIDGARIHVTGFDPRTDRVILQPPWPVDVRRVQRNPYDQRVFAGPVELVFSLLEEGLDPLPAVSVSQAPDEDGFEDLDFGALLASRRPNPEMSGGGPHGEDHGGGDDGSGGFWGLLGELGEGHGPSNGHGGGDGHGMGLEVVLDDRSTATRCGDFFDPSALDAPVQDRALDAFDAREATWRDSADTLAYIGDGVPQYLMAGGGDDLIWLFDVEEGTEIVAGDGSDLVILCSVKDVSAVVWLGRGNAGLDDEPDTLVIASQVLDGVPEGFQRVVTLYEYDPLVDRLVLPPGPWQPVAEMHGDVLSPADTRERVASYDATVTYGPIRVSLRLGQGTDPATLYRSISVGDSDPGPHIRALAARQASMIAPATSFKPVDLSTWNRARTLAGDTVTGAPPAFDCTAPPAATERPRKPEIDEHDALLIEYGETHDVIIVRSIDDAPDTGVLSQSSVHSGAGIDIVYSFTSNAALVDGPGFDLSVVCDVDALSTELVAAPDGSPDIVIVDAAVFRKPVSEGFERKIYFQGYGEPDDYIILRLPADARIEPDLVVHYRVVTPQATTRLNINGYLTADPNARPRPETIIVWPE